MKRMFYYACAFLSDESCSLDFIKIGCVGVNGVLTYVANNYLRFYIHTVLTQHLVFRW